MPVLKFVGAILQTANLSNPPSDSGPSENYIQKDFAINWSHVAVGQYDLDTPVERFFENNTYVEIPSRTWFGYVMYKVLSPSKIRFYTFEDANFEIPKDGVLRDPDNLYGIPLTIKVSS